MYKVSPKNYKQTRGQREVATLLYPLIQVKNSLLFLLVSILLESFLTLVRSHLMALSFLSAWHILIILLSITYRCLLHLH